MLETDARETSDGQDRIQLARAFGRLDPMALAVALGTVTGLALFIATLVLVLREGTLVGLHLGRLGYFLPGYQVTWSGAFVGLVEAALVGVAFGTLLALAWNGYHRLFVALIVARETRRELQQL